MLTMPQSQWTQDLLLSDFHRQLEISSGVIQHGTPFMVEEAAGGKRPNDRCVNGVASVEAISRSGLKILLSGLDLTHYNKFNPVVLAGHSQYVPLTLMPGAIATVERVSKSGDTLKFRKMRFDTDPLAEAWYQKVTKNIVRMVSVGVRPIEMEYVEEEVGKGRNRRIERYICLVESELIELSVTVIGANIGAMIDRQPDRDDGQAFDALAKELASLRTAVDALQSAAAFGETYGDASFPDAAFIVERGAEKEGGKTVHKYRHLPHHSSAAKSATENSTIDVSHLRNALARVNQVKPVKESASAYRSRATAHLKAHARAVLKSHQDLVDTLAETGNIVKDADAKDVGTAVESALGELARFT